MRGVADSVQQGTGRPVQATLDNGFGNSGIESTGSKGGLVPQAIQLEIEMPGDLAKFRLPKGVAKRLQDLLHKQDSGEHMELPFPLARHSSCRNNSNGKSDSGGAKNEPVPRSRNSRGRSGPKASSANNIIEIATIGSGSVLPSHKCAIAVLRPYGARNRFSRCCDTVFHC